HDDRDRRDGRRDPAADGRRRSPLRRVRTHRCRTAAARAARAGRPRGRGGEDTVSTPWRRAWHTIWVQLPFSLWLVAVWMMLWGQFTPLAAITGVVVALFVTRVFRLPPAELSGRIN